MQFAVPLQLIRELSFEAVVKEQQDEATKAWNFCTALYYKANRQTVPWKLVTNPNKPSACFAGISFYRSRDKKTLNTSLAQVFDELGNGVILRGTPIELAKDDRRPHLSDTQAYQLLERALSEYRVAVGNVPGRLVLHKSSNFNDAELKGFKKATTEMQVQAVDFLTIMDSDFRLFRKGIYPPYRGSHIELDKKTHLLYTRGSVKFYRTQTSLYIPQPLEVRIVESDESAHTLCREILALTKMNWNNTQFDGKYPITIGCSRKVGEVMKYLTDKDPEPQISYSFYM
jgi:argonaute-like protein implicated in RNA metabolism and viral defense